MKQYYYIRIYDEQGKEVATRCELATGPRSACKLAFGVIYDKSTDRCKYRAIGKKRPGDLSDRKAHELRQEGPDWKPMPSSGM